MLAVADWIDVPSTGDDQTLQSIEDPCGDFGTDGLGRQQDRDAACGGDRVEIVLLQENRRQIPHAGLRLLQIGR